MKLAAGAGAIFYCGDSNGCWKSLLPFSCLGVFYQCFLLPEPNRKTASEGVLQLWLVESQFQNLEETVDGWSQGWEIIEKQLVQSRPTLQICPKFSLILSLCLFAQCYERISQVKLLAHWFTQIVNILLFSPLIGSCIMFGIMFECRRMVSFSRRPAYLLWISQHLVRIVLAYVLYPGFLPHIHIHNKENRFLERGNRKCKDPEVKGMHLPYLRKSFLNLVSYSSNVWWVLVAGSCWCLRVKISSFQWVWNFAPQVGMPYLEKNKNS